MELIIAIIGGVLVGVLAGIFVFGKSTWERFNQDRVADANRQAEEANRKADQTIQEARTTAERTKQEAQEQGKKIVQQAQQSGDNLLKTKELEAKERFLQRKSDFEAETAQRRQALKDEELVIKTAENNLKQLDITIKAQNQSLLDKTKNFEKKEAEIEAIRENLNAQLGIVADKEAELEKAQEVHLTALENVAKMTQLEAKEELMQVVRTRAEADALALIKDTIDQAKLQATKESKKIVIQTIQRMAAEITIENTVSVFNLDSDDLKGQIIGREGRNIRAIEAATGAEIVVDDTPEAIVISSFDPIRREVARLALQRLVADGRIHPARIEEVVAKTRKQLEEQIMEIGERTVMELGIHGLNPALVRMVGRMRFRSSYGQNLLKHSIETANLCAIMAAELGLTAKQAKMAKRAGLLHDIGKVAEEETEMSHAIVGMKMCEKWGEHAVICNAVGAHHDEIEMNNILSPIVQACDAISGARPGARREILESYMERIKELENIAASYPGVQKAYAIQAGRELRVMVESEKVTDQESDTLSFTIANRIQNEMTYPGQIKVTVIRETRATSFAR
jgi:ribonucrease Y